MEGRGHLRMVAAEQILANLVRTGVQLDRLVMPPLPITSSPMIMAAQRHADVRNTHCIAQRPLDASLRPFVPAPLFAEAGENATSEGRKADSRSRAISYHYWRSRSS